MLKKLTSSEELISYPVLLLPGIVCIIGQYEKIKAFHILLGESMLLFNIGDHFIL